MTSHFFVSQECKEDCAADWDTVEEISSAVAKSKPIPQANTTTKISPEAKDFIMKTQAALSQAQKSATVSPDTMKMLFAAQASASKVATESKAKDPRLPAIEEALRMAIESAKECKDGECPFP